MVCWHIVVVLELEKAVFRTEMLPAARGKLAEHQIVVRLHRRQH